MSQEKTDTGELLDETRHTTFRLCNVEASQFCGMPTEDPQPLSHMTKTKTKKKEIRVESSAERALIVVTIGHVTN
ncbi:hypothetical protein F2P81_022949 [Scophthalmus maximus]|uniref:Uncharacterized protein n=1 Tax=Scophthalmus maximus TaxID=52904 RepID=A0A6A4RV08_SCOMX|nr:hypothetical protein F2P81_022949 [Scophthalmus maximus]